MDPFSIAAGSVAEQILAAGLKKLRPSWRWRLARRIANDSHGAVKQSDLRHFLQGPQAFRLLAAGTPEARGQLEDRIGKLVHTAQPTWSADDVSSATTRVVFQIVTGLMRFLSPSDALAIATDRQMSASARLEAGQDRLEQLMQDSDTIDLHSAQLPPPAARALEELRTLDPQGASRLARFLVAHRHGAAVACVDVVDASPGWIESLSPGSWLVLAEAAAAYGRGKTSLTAFSRALDTGASPPTRWLARTAIAAHAADDDELAREVLEREDDDPFMAFAASVIDENAQVIVERANALIEESPDHPDASLILVLRARAEHAMGLLDRAQSTCEQVKGINPEQTSALILSAELLLRRIQDGRTTARHREWRTAVDSAISARDLRRRWSGPSEDAVEVLCKAAALERDWALVLRYGLEAPRGEAIEREARDARVVTAVMSAATLLGEIDVASELTQYLHSDFDVQFQMGLLNERRDGSREESVAHYLAAVDASRNVDELSQALMGLASLGQWPLDRLDEVERVSPEQAATIVAMSALEREDFVAASAALRPHRDTSARALDLAAMISHASGDIDRAVTLLRQGYNRYQSVDLLVRIVSILVQQGRNDDALSEVDSAIQIAPADSSHLRDLRQYAIRLRGLGGDWTNVAAQARALLSDNAGESSDAKWWLVQAQWNLGLFDDARATLDEFPEFRPRTTEEAMTWLALKRRVVPTEDLVTDVVEIAADFTHSEEAGGSALLLAHELSRELKLSQPVVERLAAVTRAYAASFPESKVFREFHFSSPEEMLEQLRTIVGPESGAGVADEVRQVVEAFRPVGLIGLAAGRTYTEVLLRRAAGCMPVARSDPSKREAQITAAGDSLNGVVAVDLSAFASLSLAPSYWDQLRTAFDQIIIHWAARADAERAAAEFGVKSTKGVVWDPQTGRPIVWEITDAQAESLATRAVWMLSKSGAAEVVSNELSEFPEVDVHKMGSWLGAIDVAKREGCALMADDIGLQWLADSMSVSVFSTLDLASVHGISDSESYNAYRQELLRNWGVDIPITLHDLLSMAAEDSWHPGPAAYQLTRRALWSDPTRALDLFRRLISEVQRSHPDELWIWTSAALRGVALSTLSQWPEVGSNILIMSASMSGFDPATFGACVQAAESIALEYGRESLLAMTLTSLLRDFTRQFGEAAAMSEGFRMIFAFPDPLRQRAGIVLLQAQ